jgi:hypothetical protein
VSPLVRLFRLSFLSWLLPPSERARIAATTFFRSSIGIRGSSFFGGVGAFLCRICRIPHVSG